MPVTLPENATDLESNHSEHNHASHHQQLLSLLAPFLLSAAALIGCAAIIAFFVPFTRYHVLRVQERPWQERVAAWNATRIPSFTSPTTA
jgi:hypothetical protein